MPNPWALGILRVIWTAISAMVKIKHLPGKVQIVLAPNRSLSWRQSKVIMGCFALFCLTIAIAWSLVGAWLILPFAGLELGLLLFITYLVSKSTYRQQIILINPEYVSLHKRDGKQQQKYLLKHDAAKLLTYETHHPDDALSLYLRDDDTVVRVAEFLNLDDQKRLITLLDKAHIRLIKKSREIALEC